MKKRILRFVSCILTLSMMLSFLPSVSYAVTDDENILFHDDFTTFDAFPNVYGAPNADLFIADSSFTGTDNKKAPDGQILAYAAANAGGTYRHINYQCTNFDIGTSGAWEIALRADIKDVPALNKNFYWRGFYLEMVARGMEFRISFNRDPVDNSIYVNTFKTSNGDNGLQRAKIDVLPGMHDYSFTYDGKSKVYFTIDGMTIATFDNPFDAESGNVLEFGNGTWSEDGDYKSGTCEVYIDDLTIRKPTMNDQMTVDNTKDNLTFDQIRGQNLSVDAVESNLSLPSEYLGASLSWVSTNPSAISNTGVVTQSATASNATLTATITKGTATATKEFSLTVPAIQSGDDALSSALAALTDQSILGMNPSTDDIYYDLNCPTVDTKNGVAISWLSSNIAAIANDGKVSRTDTIQTTSMTATLSKGGVTRQKTINLTVKPATKVRTGDNVIFTDDMASTAPWVTGGIHTNDCFITDDANAAHHAPDGQFYVGSAAKNVSYPARLNCSVPEFSGAFVYEMVMDVQNVQTPTTNQGWRGFAFELLDKDGNTLRAAINSLDANGNAKLGIRILDGSAVVQDIKIPKGPVSWKFIYNGKDKLIVTINDVPVTTFHNTLYKQDGSNTLYFYSDLDNWQSGFNEVYIDAIALYTLPPLDENVLFMDDMASATSWTTGGTHSDDCFITDNSSAVHPAPKGQFYIGSTAKSVYSSARIDRSVPEFSGSYVFEMVMDVRNVQTPATNQGWRGFAFELLDKDGNTLRAAINSLDTNGNAKLGIRILDGSTIVHDIQIPKGMATWKFIYNGIDTLQVLINDSLVTTFHNTLYKQDGTNTLYFYSDLDNWQSGYNEVYIDTVLLMKEPITDEMLVDNVKNNLTFEQIRGENITPDNIEQNLSLPNEDLGAKYSWSSSNTDVISNSGVVTLSDIAANVTLTATISIGTATDTCVFNLSVPPAQSGDSAVTNALAALTDAVILGKNASIDSVYYDLNCMTMDTKNGVVIAWESLNTNAVAPNGKVTRAVEDQTATLTAKLSKNGVTRQKSITVIVKALTPIRTGDNVIFTDDMASVAPWITGGVHSNDCFITDDNNGAHPAPTGQFYIGSTAKSVYYAARLNRSVPEFSDSYVFEMIMDVRNVQTPSKNQGWRGFSFELIDKDGNTLRAAINSLDANGNAKLGIRSLNGDPVVNDIVIPKGPASWKFIYNGLDKLQVTINNKLVTTFNTALYKQDGSNSLYFYSDLDDWQSGFNEVYVDSISLYTKYSLDGLTVSSDSSAQALKINAAVYCDDPDAFTSKVLTLDVSVSNGESIKKQTYTITASSSTLTVTNVGMTGNIELTATLKYNGKSVSTKKISTYLSESNVLLSDNATFTSSNDSCAVYSAMNSSVLNATTHKWAVSEYSEKGSSEVKYLLETNGSGDALTIPVTLNGKVGVYIGYVNGTNEIDVSADNLSKTLVISNAFIAPSKMYLTNIISEDFALAGDFNEQNITITPHAGKNARIAYIKFVSLTDDEFALYNKPNVGNKTFAIDNDGFSDFANGLFSDTNALKYNTLQKLSEQAGIGELVWCLGTTAMLNYDSPSVWSYFKDTELAKKPKDMFDIRDANGSVINYESQLRRVDIRAREDILSFNYATDDSAGWPLSILATEGDALNVKVTASLRMRAFYNMATDIMFNGIVYPKLGKISYDNPVLRNYVKNIVLECAASPNVDGVMLDFGRYPWVFENSDLSLSEQKKIMNDFISDISIEMKKLGKKLSTRILVESGSSIDQGLDYPTWIQNKWIDRLITTVQSFENYYPYTSYLNLCKENGVEYYLGITADLTGDDLTTEQEKLMEQGMFVPNNTYLSIGNYLNRAYQAYQDGVDGIYLFNTLNDVQFIKNISPKFAYLGDKVQMQKWHTFETRAETINTPIFITKRGSTSNDAAYSGLGYLNSTVSPIIPSFNPEELNYMLSVPYYFDSFKLSCAAAIGNANMTVSVNNVIQTPVGDSYTIPLSSGKNTVKITVTSKDMSKSRTYTILATRKLPANVSHGDKLAVTVTSAPTASSITYGQTLASSALTGGVTTAHNTSSVPGRFVWTDNSVAPLASDTPQFFNITFIPNDQDTYASVKTTAKIKVNPAEQNAPTGLSSIAASRQGAADGRILGLDKKATYEYKKSGTDTYIKKTGATEIYGLVSGEYSVRLANIPGKYLESKDVVITVSDGARKGNVYVGGIANGSITVTPARAAAGERVMLTVTPAKGYALTAGSLKYGSTPITQVEGTNQYSFVMPSPAEDITIAASFERGTFAVYISGSGGTHIGSGNYHPGDTVTITAVSNTNYRFTGWTIVSGDVVLSTSTNATSSFTMPENAVTIRALYEYIGGGSSSGGGGSTGSGGSGGMSGGTGGSSGAGNTETPNSGNASGTETTTPPTTPMFSDTQNHWAKDAINYVVEKGLFNGTSGNTFSPDLSMTRGMFVTVLGRLAGISADATTSSFIDVTASSYYAPYIEWAYKNGIVSGVGNSNFSPDTEMTREQMAVMLIKFASKQGYKLNSSLDAIAFSDTASISSWASDAVNTAHNSGLITGKSGGVFDPQGNATRAEVAAIVMRFITTASK